jgi:hypothetical protein
MSAWTCLNHFVAGEELRDLDGGRLRSIGTMHRIFPDRFRMQLANRALRRLGRIGCAHHVTVFQDGVFAFKDLHHHRA